MSLLQSQKNSVLKILQTVVEGNDLEFTEEIKTKKIQNINTVKKVGRSLIEHKSQWKVLIFDEFSKNILVPLLKVGDLKGLGVTLRMNIKDKREQISDAPALYIIQPTRENIDLICQDCEKNLYESFYLNFVQPSTRDTLEYLATKLVENGCTDKIAKVYDQFLNFLCVETNFFTLDLKEIFINIHKKKNQTEDELLKILEPVINGLISVVLTMEMIPIIACEKGGNAEIVSRKLEKKLKNLLSDRTYLYQYQVDSYHKKRPVLIITDRDIDYAVCIQHKWIYKSMVHDLFNMKQNTVFVSELKKEEAIEDDLINSKKKKYDIDFDDEFWNENSNSRFEDFAEILTKKLKEYTTSLGDFNKKTGLNLEEDALLGEQAVDNIKGEQKLSQNMVDDVMSLIEGKKRINMHVNISYAVLHEIKTRKLDEFVAIEESLIENRQLDKNLLLTLVRDDKKGSIEDKLRLLLIDYLAKLQCQNASSLNKSEVEELERIILQGRGTYSIPEYETLKYLTSHLELKEEKKHKRYESSNMIFNSILQMGQNIVKGNELEVDLPITQLVSQIMEKKLDSILYLDPKSVKNSTISIDGFNDAIVFVIGGGNYLEHDNLTKYAQKNSKSIVYGCSNIVTGSEFLGELNVGVDGPLKDAGFDFQSFTKRGGYYDWTRELDTFTEEEKKEILNRRNSKRNNLISSVCFMLWTKCNYSCEFCWHPDKQEDSKFDLSAARHAISLLIQNGAKKINFCGGEPFYKKKGEHLGELLKYTKLLDQDCFTSVVSNGSLIEEKWMENYSKYLDSLAISVDSFEKETNQKIGRKDLKQSTLPFSKLLQLKHFCEKYEIKFKLNTVVNTSNYEENMINFVKELNPIRWKVFQVAPRYNQNYGPDAPNRMNVEKYLISKNQFQSFVDFHKKEIPYLQDESVDDLDNSYLVLDPNYCFSFALDDGTEKPTKSILDIGVENALKESSFCEEKRRNRKGSGFDIE
eukprot:gene3664-6479_t